MIDRLLESNKTFISDEFEPNSGHYLKIAAKQTPRAVWINVLIQE
jgi:carbonic anhydrase